MLSYKMDFSFCACKPGLVKSSHICTYVYVCIAEMFQKQFNNEKFNCSHHNGLRTLTLYF